MSQIYYAQYCIGGEVFRVSLKTDSLQVAKDKVRNIESALARGADLPMPTRTPIADVVAPYVEHIRATKTRNGYKVDLWYLRQIFGPICPALEIPRRGKKKRPATLLDKLAERLAAPCFEEINTAQVSTFIARMVQTRGLAPKTANRYREIIQRVFNWATKQRGIRTPNNVNPAAQVERYREKARTIRFLSLRQIAEQLQALEAKPLLQTIVAVYIYAGLRREETLWLTHEDIDLKVGPHGVIKVQAKTVNGEFWQPKTKTNRVVPISATLRKYLDRYQPRIVPGHWHFPSPEGRHWDPDNFSEALRVQNQKAKLPWSCLDYRHTFGSQLAMKGESLYKIATLMGNSPEISRKHYAVLTPQSLAISVDFQNEKLAAR